MQDNKIFTSKLIIKETHLDFMGHVNNATYLEILEEARWDVLFDQNYKFQDILKSGVGPVILECEIKFQKEIKLREEVVIKTEFGEYKNKTGVINQVIVNQNDAICTKAKFIYGFFDMKLRKLVEPDEKLAKIMGINF